MRSKKQWEENLCSLWQRTSLAAVSMCPPVFPGSVNTVSLLLRPVPPSSCMESMSFHTFKNFAFENCCFSLVCITSFLVCIILFRRHRRASLIWKKILPPHSYYLLHLSSFYCKIRWKKSRVVSPPLLPHVVLWTPLHSGFLLTHRPAEITSRRTLAYSRSRQLLRLSPVPSWRAFLRLAFRAQALVVLFLLLVRLSLSFAHPLPSMLTCSCAWDLWIHSPYLPLVI